MGRGARLVTALVLTGLVGVLPTASAEGAITLGSDLSGDPANAPCSPGNCTLANLVVPGRAVSSPVDGQLITWRVRYENNLGVSARLRVIEQLSGAFLGVNSSVTQALPLAGLGTFRTESYSTAQPIRSGQLIGLDLDGSTNNIGMQMNFDPSVDAVRWEPTLLDGATSSSGIPSHSEYTFNADLVPADTTITSHPKAVVKTRKKRKRVSFSFVTNQPGLGFACALDRQPFAPCTSPTAYRVRRGRHHFEVEGTLGGMRFGDVASSDFRVKRKKKR